MRNLAQARKTSIVLFALIPWSAFYSQDLARLKDLSKVNLKIGSKDCKTGKAFSAIAVNTPKSLARGLGGRPKPMGPNEGMLFVFSEPRISEFWMKDTLIPLQIGFFDKDGRLVIKHEMPVEPNPSTPEKIYSSIQPASSALEVAPSALDEAAIGTSYLCIDLGRLPAAPLRKAPLRKKDPGIK